MLYNAFQFTKYRHILQIHCSVPFPYYQTTEAITKIQTAMEVQKKEVLYN